MERHELVRANATTRYWTDGDAGDPALVFLHGATLDHRSWDPQVEALRSRHRVVVPDLRGHGESAAPEPFAFASAVDDVVTLLDELGLERVGLVGLSLGGNIAQEIVHRDPGRVAALVVADSTCNTAARHALQAPMSIAALSGLGLMGREAFPAGHRERHRPERRGPALRPRGQPDAIHPELPADPHCDAQRGAAS
jgi:pimeloyl-ACP methyl ester carboxylesterase